MQQGLPVGYEWLGPACSLAYASLCLALASPMSTHVGRQAAIFSKSPKGIPGRSTSAPEKRQDQVPLYQVLELSAAQGEA